MEIKVTIQDAEVKSLLAAVSSRYGNMRPVFHDIGEMMIKRVRDRFDSETDPDGNPWKPLSSLTLQLGLGGTRGGFKKSGYLGASGRRYLQAKKILFGTGALRDDIHPQYDNTHVEWGTSGRIPYAGIHQFGGTIRPKHGKALRVPGVGARGSVTIPARPYLGRNVGDGMEIAPADRQAAIEMIMTHLSPP